MSSRADFLKAMGISENDMSNPDEAPAPAPPSRNYSSGNRSSLVSNLEREDPNIAHASASAFAGRKASSSSMSGLGSRNASASFTGSSVHSPSYAENDRHENSYRSATGSQEIPAAPAMSTSGTFGGAAPAGGVKKTRAELAQEAEQHKQEGNAAFQNGEYRKAIRCYSKAIECDSTNAALYSNRSAAYLAGAAQTGMDTRSLALRDATRATEIRPDWAKGYARQGEALMELERYHEAREAYEKAMEFDAANPNYQKRVEECNHYAPIRRTPSAINHSMSESVLPPRTGSARDLSHSGSVSGVSARELQAKYMAEGNSALDGRDFKERELERLRERRSHGSFSSSSNPATPLASLNSTSGDKPKVIPGYGSTGHYSEARNVPEEFSSNAAKAYQQSLIEAYRKKKQQS